MEKIKKGDIVGRLSYGKDVLFKVEKVKKNNEEKLVILKGLTERIEADSPIDDVEIIEEKIISENIRKLDRHLENRIKRCLVNDENLQNRLKRKAYTGTILHLDGDRRYSIKALGYYKKVGLNVVVKNILEKNQPKFIKVLLKMYNPDILVITGHDGMIRKEKDYKNINNYRNSKYFIESVRAAREVRDYGKDLVVFAGACQSYYEALIAEGANFASSPARVLIDFVDPLIVAEKIATTDTTKIVTINDIKDELRDGEKGISGVGARGKKIL